MKTLRFSMLVFGMMVALFVVACAPAAAPTRAPPTAAPSQPTAAPAQATSAPSGGDTIKIGGGFALTGDESALDLPAANGAKLAAKEINAAGGVSGSQIDFIVHDSQYKMDVTAQVAKQF